MKVTSVIDIKEMIRNLRSGASERGTAEALGTSRNTVKRYKALAEAQGWLEASQPLPEEAAIAQAVKGLFAPSAQTVSKLEPHRVWIEERRAAGVSMAKIHRQLNTERQVPCAYWVVWSYITHLEAKTPEVTVRVETAPGEEAQVDFGYVGRMWDPATQTVRKAWEFVMTLSWSRHQVAPPVCAVRVRPEGGHLAAAAPGGVRVSGRGARADQTGQSQGRDRARQRR
jgi:transposase